MIKFFSGILNGGKLIGEMFSFVVFWLFFGWNVK